MAGAGYKLFNTGDVLTAAQVNTYLMEQTVMVFADAAARTTALTGVVSEGMISYLKDTNAVEVYNGSAWVSSDDPNAIQNTIVDAKGDLITATAADTPSRLAVGNNGETLVADSSATTGLRWQATGLANPIINGAFDIWQRGTSFSAASNNTFTADRWPAGGNGNALTVSRQSTNDTTNLPNIQYCARVQRDSGNTNTFARVILQNLETANTFPFIGKTITLSFYARKGADYSSASDALDVRLTTGTGTDQNSFSTYTGSSNIISSNVTLTTTWQRFSLTGTVGTTALEMSPSFRYTPVGTAGAADYFEVTGVQIDIGSVALPFRRSGGTFAGELAACQRYYVRFTSANVFGNYAHGSAYSTTAANIGVHLPVMMRANGATSVDFSTLRLQDGVGAQTVTGLTLSDSSTDYALVAATVASGLTQYRPYFLGNNNNVGGYIGFNAEL